jgi:hypothetical protein
MKKSMVFLVTVVIVFSAAAGLHFYRQKAAQISMLFSGYQLESITSGGGQVETNPETLQSLSEGSLQPGHTYIFRKVERNNYVRFARYRLPVRLWLAHCRATKVGKPAIVFAGDPVFNVEYECNGHRGIITNRLVVSADETRSEEQLVVTLE